MSTEDNVKTVQTVYEAFGRGDVPTMLESLTDDVDWASEAWSTDAPAPWWGVKHGKDGVAAFFQAFGTAMDVEEFTPTVIAANGDHVLTVVHFKTTSRATGRTAEMDLHHHFRFRDGLIASYRGTEDTQQTAETLKA
jgi:uncharacterized protein